MCLIYTLILFSDPKVIWNLNQVREILAGRYLSTRSGGIAVSHRSHSVERSLVKFVAARLDDMLGRWNHGFLSTDKRPSLERVSIGT